MKRKIFSVLFALVLVLSFSLVMATPATAANTAAANVRAGVSLRQYTDSTAAWSTTQHTVGTYSAKLTLPAAPTADDGAMALITVGTGWYTGGTMALSAFTSFVYKWYVATSCDATYAPHMVICLHDPSDATKKIDITLEVSDPVTPSLSGAYTKGSWVTQTITPGGSGSFWWNNANGSTAAAKGTDATPAENVRGSLALICADSVFSAYRIDMIGIEFGWWGGTTVGGTAYVDGATINGATYAIEPSVINTNTTEGFDKIQDAIDATNTVDGNTITVAAGTHIENVTVDKSVILHGASSATVTVSAADVNAHVFNVSADSVTISGFTVSGAADPYAGIYLGPDVTLCNIHDNILLSNFDGIFLDIGSNHNTLTSNTVSSNTRQGFEIIQSDYNTFTSNIANTNTKYGFKMESASHNTFTSNTANSNSQDGFRLTTGSNEGATGCNYNTFTSNTVNSNTNNGFNMLGRVAGDSNHNVLTNNTISSNEIGISIGDAFVDVSTMTVLNNIIAGNSNYGISNSGTGTLDASSNWWGDVAGPYIETNPYYSWTGSGTEYTSGDHVSTNVEYIPWLIHKDLAAGWNIFSTPITSGTSTDTIAEALNLWTSDSAKVLNAYYFNAATQHWLVATDLTPLVPVYLNLSSAATIDVLMSTDYSSPPAKTMYQGWNLVGPAQLYSMDVDDALGSAYYGTGGANPIGYSQVVSPGINQVAAWTFLRGDEMYGAHHAPNVLPTEGYWVYMVNQGTLGGFTYTPITEVSAP